MSDFMDYKPNEIDVAAIIGDASKGWLRPFLGTGVGMPEEIETARAAWIDLKNGLAEAQAKADSIATDEDLTDAGKQRRMALAAKDFENRFSEVERRLNVVKMHVANLEIHLEKQGKPTPDATDLFGMEVWKQLGDVDEFNLKNLYFDYIEAEPTKPDAGRISATIKQCLILRRGSASLMMKWWPRVGAAVVN